MVVALLGLLFVSGVALLTTVTFETKTLSVVRETRETQVAISAIEQIIFRILRDGFLGPDGKPYNAPTGNVVDASGLVVLPATGEVPGIHTWVDFTEPQEDGTDAGLSLYSDLRRALDRRTSLAVASVLQTSPDIDKRQVPILFGQSFIDLDEGQYATDIGYDQFVDATPRPARIQDADGDGIPDSYSILLDSSVLPPDIKAAISERLRDPNAINARDPDALWLTLKIVPHGSMVNINTHIPYCDVLSIPGNEYYPDMLVENALGYSDFEWQLRLTNGDISDSYLPESQEWALRSRGLMVPRSVPGTRLFTELADRLLYPHSSLAQTAAASAFLDNTNRRWWQYDEAALPTYNNSIWRQMLDPIGTATSSPYDRVHLVTTISHDDNLIRSASAGGLDMIDAISTNGLFVWGNYPDYLPVGDQRKGRLKFSFPYFSKNQANGGGLPANSNGLDDLTPVEKNNLAMLVQDAFILQLRNHAGVVDFDTNGTIDLPTDFPADPLNDDNRRLSIIAASLAANFIDFVDNDQTVGDIPDEPTRLAVRDWRTGAIIDPDLNVYGLERQPFITEVLIDVPATTGTFPAPPMLAAGASVFAIELYNPYDVPINLSVYKLVDLADPATINVVDGAGNALTRFTGTMPLGGIMAPRSFAVFHGYGNAAGAASATQLGDFVIDRQSIIAL
ncbi:MAG: hypothetical protein GXP29_03985, partial [Planctomycetes bacterium]|nr:hypothetical protein [Planctomycetota bacterium]